MIRHRNRGFTLVEIAVVLVIASLLLAAGIGITVAVLENTRARATKQNLEGVKLALQSFIARYGRFPCPAVEALAPANAAYGIEDTRTTNPATSCTNTVNLPGAAGIDAAKRGVVPWKTLGITLENASDGWGNQFTYMVSVTPTTLNFETLSGTRGSLYVHSATPVAAGLPATGNQLNACSTTANDNSCNRAAVVVLISHGKNIFGAFTQAGVQAPLPTDLGELENTNADRFVVSMGQSNTFDDMVQPFTPDDLLGPLAAQGAIKSERSVLQERARQVLALVMGDAVVNRTGGPGTYTYFLIAPSGPVAYSLDATRYGGSCPTVPQVGTLGFPFTQVVDPWGRPFLHARAKTALNAGDTCPTPWVVVSLGPDNTLGTADDFVYYSPLGEWMDVLGKAGW